MFIHFPKCTYMSVPRTYYSIVHRRFIHGTDMSVHVYARWSGFQMLTRFLPTNYRDCHFREESLETVTVLTCKRRLTSLYLDWQAYRQNVREVKSKTQQSSEAIVLISSFNDESISSVEPGVNFLSLAPKGFFAVFCVPGEALSSSSYVCEPAWETKTI